MNYITLINQFWRVRRSKRVTSVEADLYFYLMNVCNELNWENPFEHPNKLIVATIGVTEKTMIEARNRLKQKGLIDFEPGKRKAKSPVYTILYSNNSSIKESKKECKKESKKGQDKAKRSRKVGMPNVPSTFPDTAKKEPQINYQEYVDSFHLACPKLPKVRAMSDARKRAIKARIKEYGEEVVKQVIESAGKSEFLAGKNKRGWTASFDWIFKPTNFIKIMEGNYSNKPGKSDLDQQKHYQPENGRVCDW
jgi:hypothetical protein